MGEDISARIARLEEGQAALREQVAKLDGEVGHLREQVARLNGEASQMDKRLSRIESDMRRTWWTLIAMWATTILTILLKP